jgi:hypothetical protein
MKNPVIRTIYLYLFALIGLGMFVVGSSMLINLGLKTFIFTQADSVDNYRSVPPTLYMKSDIDNVKELQACSDKCNLTDLQKEQIDNWLVDYETWQNMEENKDPDFYTVRNRERQASSAISIILVGFPLWLFHWMIIKKDVKRKKED